MPDRPTPRPLDASGVAGAILCCMLWGGNAVAVKFSIPDIPPMGCAGLRFLLALPVIAWFCWRSGQPLWAPRNHWGLVILHAGITVAQIYTFNWGTSHGTAGRASIFINVHPLVVAPLAWLVLGERLGLRGLGGLLAAALGLLVLLAEPLRRGGAYAGDLIVLLSGAIFAVQTIAQKLTFSMLAPTTLLWGQSVLAIPMFLLFSAWGEGADAYHFTPLAVWGLVYQGLAVSGVCFAVWMILLRRYEASRLATLAFLTPVFGVGFGSLMRGETLTVPLIAGGALVGLGIYLVASDRSTRRPANDEELPGEDAP